MKLGDPTTWMWSEALELLDRADRLHRQFFQLEHHSQQRPNWEPPVDIFETEKELVVLVALPGVTPERLAVTIDGTDVIIYGQRALPDACKSALIHRLEIPYGRFERRIALPSKRFQLGQQSLQDGCLVLTLSKLR